MGNAVRSRVSCCDISEKDLSKHSLILPGTKWFIIAVCVDAQLVNRAVTQTDGSELRLFHCVPLSSLCCCLHPASPPHPASTPPCLSPASTPVCLHPASPLCLHPAFGSCYTLRSGERGLVTLFQRHYYFCV